MIETQPLEINEFSLGQTDYYIDGKPSAAQEMTNFILTPNKKPRSRWGSVIVNDQLPLGSFRINKLALLKNNLLAFQDKRAYRDNAGVWSEIQGPSSGTFLPVGDSNSVIIDSEWQDHVLFTSDEFISPQKAFIDSGGSYRVRNAGLPSMPAGTSVGTPSGSGSSYLYAFCFYYEYTVGSVTYIDRGPVFYYPSTVTGGAINGGNTVSITLPTSLATPENWDTTSIDLEIYRTTDAGDTYYRAGAVNFGATPFIDNVDDTTLQTNETLYTTGGIASNDSPPKAKYVHVVNDFAYYGHIKNGTEVESTLIIQSKSGDPDSVPSAFYAYAEQPVTGVSSIYDRPVVLCDKYIYRVDNYFADDGSGGMFLRRIDDKAGCISAQSIVQTHLGLFWFGDQGVYWTDGFRVESVSPHLNTTYKTLVSNETKKKRINGTFDPSNHRIYWSVSVDEPSNENDQMLVLDLKFPFLPSQGTDGGCFTFHEGGESFRPTQVLRFGNYYYRGDSRGYLFKHGPEYLTDPKINTLTAPSTWDIQAIIWVYKSCFLDFGSKFYRKFVPRILVSADNTTNLSLAISSSNDNNRVRGDLKPIRYRNAISWGDSLPVWGDPSARWNIQGLIEEWRRFPAGGLRCNYKQVSFTNAELLIVDYTLLGQVTVNAVTKTATLGGTYTWLNNILDYYISFSHDNYEKKFLITARTTTTITYSDPGNAGPSVNGLYDWKLTGIQKGEIFQLNGYVLHWAYLSKSHTPFSASSLGGSA